MQALKTRGLMALEALVILGLVLAVLYPLNPDKQPIPSRDSGVFLYTGWRILNGELPYLHVWDHKPPVIYYLDALGLSLTQGTPWGVWWIEVVFLFGAATLLYALIKRFWGLFPAILASFLWLFTLIYMLARGNSTEEYPLVMQAGALFLFYLAEKNKKYGWRGVLIGVLAGLTFFTRQTSIGIFIAIGGYLLIARLWQRDFRRLTYDLFSILVGGSVVVGIVYFYFKSNGAMGRFWDNAFLYNFLYIGEKDTEDRLGSLLKGMDLLANVGLAPLSMFGWATSLIMLIFKRNHFAEPLRAFLWMTLLALPLEVALVTIGGRPRTPYFITMLPVFAIFGGMGLHILFDWLKHQALPKIAGPIVTIILILTIGALVYNDYVDINTDKPASVQDIRLLTYIAQNTTPQDTVLMWGAETAYNFVAKRPSPTRFVYQYDLYKSIDEKNGIEFLNDILTKKTKLIVMTSVDPEITDFHFAFRSEETGKLIDQINSIYKRVKLRNLKRWIIYKFQGTP